MNKELNRSELKRPHKMDVQVKVDQVRQFYARWLTFPTLKSSCKPSKNLRHGTQRCFCISSLLHLYKKRESYLILHPRWFSVVIWKGMRKSPLVLSLIVHGLWHNLWGRNEICLHVEFTPCSCTRRLAVRPVILPCVYLLFLTASSLDSLPPRQGLKYFFFKY